MEYQVTVKGFKSGLNELLVGRVYDHRTKKYRNAVKNKNDAICAKYIKASKDLQGVKIVKPIVIHYSFYCENKMHDRMNIASAFIKSFEDALQKCEVIKNDGFDDVLTPTLHFEIDKHNPRVEIVIEEKESENVQND